MIRLECLLTLWLCEVKVNDDIACFRPYPQVPTFQIALSRANFLNNCWVKSEALRYWKTADSVRMCTICAYMCVIPRYLKVTDWEISLSRQYPCKTKPYVKCPQLKCSFHVQKHPTDKKYWAALLFVFLHYLTYIISFKLFNNRPVSKLQTPFTT